MRKKECQAHERNGVQSSCCRNKPLMSFQQNTLEGQTCSEGLRAEYRINVGVCLNVPILRYHSPGKLMCNNPPYLVYLNPNITSILHTGLSLTRTRILHLPILRMKTTGPKRKQKCDHKQRRGGWRGSAVMISNSRCMNTQLCLN